MPLSICLYEETTSDDGRIVHEDVRVEFFDDCEGYGGGRSESDATPSIRYVAGEQRLLYGYRIWGIQNVKTATGMTCNIEGDVGVEQRYLSAPSTHDASSVDGTVFAKHVGSANASVADKTLQTPRFEVCPVCYQNAAAKIRHVSVPGRGVGLERASVPQDHSSSCFLCSIVFEETVVHRQSVLLKCDHVQSTSVTRRVVSEGAVVKSPFVQVLCTACEVDCASDAVLVILDWHGTRNAGMVLLERAVHNEHGESVRAREKAIINDRSHRSPTWGLVAQKRRPSH